MRSGTMKAPRIHVQSTDRHRPLAAGFVTGNSVTGNTEGTRFSKDNPLGKAFQGLFGAEDLRRAMARFLEVAAAQNMSPVEVAVRWIFHHSALSEEDGVILGASKVDQVKEVLVFAQKGPLPEDVLAWAGNVWEEVKTSRADIM